MYQPTCDMSLVTIIYLFHIIFFCGRRVYLRQQKEPLIIYAHFICILKPAAAAAKSLQLCPTLCDPRDGSPPGSPVPRILQARILECKAFKSSSLHHVHSWQTTLFVTRTFSSILFHHGTKESFTGWSSFAAGLIQLT